MEVDAVRAVLLARLPGALGIVAREPHDIAGARDCGCRLREDGGLAGKRDPHGADVVGLQPEVLDHLRGQVDVASGGVLVRAPVDGPHALDLFPVRRVDDGAGGRRQMQEGLGRFAVLPADRDVAQPRLQPTRVAGKLRLFRRGEKPSGIARRRQCIPHEREVFLGHHRRVIRPAELRHLAGHHLGLQRHDDGGGGDRGEDRDHAQFSSDPCG